MSTGNNDYDVIVIGAGHNGLTAACMLARGGRRVLVVERRNVTGGVCAGEEFHPGYRTAGLLHDTAGFRKWVADALALHEHGLSHTSEALNVFSPQRSGRGLVVSRDTARTTSEIGAFSAEDAKSYAAWRNFVDRVSRVVADVMNEVPADWVDVGAGGASTMFRQAMGVRRLGKRDMIELIREAPMCVADCLDYWFETGLLKSSLAAPAILGGWCGPRSPGTATNLLLWECLAGPPVEGGPAAVTFALERAAKHLGVEIQTSTAVELIRVDKTRVAGIRLVGGEEITAPVVASSCDPKKTFLEFLEPKVLAPKFERRVRSWRARGTTAKVNLALDGPLRFEGREDEVFAFARTGEELDQLERAFDPVKYRQKPDRPLLDIFVPSVSRPELAPDGHSVVSILVHFIPYDYDAGWGDDEREKLGDSVLAELEAYAPGVTQSVVAREVLTPLDIEERYGLTGGHIYHGEHGLDQVAVRPTPETCRYHSPIEGLYLCGAGAHPGGGVTCAPGALAARVISKHS